VVSAWYAAVGHGALIVWLGRHGESDLSTLAVRGVGWVSASAGLVALSAARDLRQTWRDSGVSALAEQRGVFEREQTAARVLATVSVVARAVLLPSLLIGLCTFSVSGTVAAGIAAVLRLIAFSVYSVVFGVVLGSLSTWSAAVSPRHPRSLFAAIVLGPELARLVEGDIPSVVHFLGRALTEIDRIAGGIG
jgi:hypothetical protein